MKARKMSSCFSLGVANRGYALNNAKACSSLLGLIISVRGPSGSLDSVRRKRSQYEPLTLAMVRENESWSGWAVVEQGS